MPDPDEEYSEVDSEVYEVIYNVEKARETVIHNVEKGYMYNRCKTPGIAFLQNWNPSLFG